MAMTARGTTEMAWPDPRALLACLDHPAARRLDERDRQALREALPRATRSEVARELIVVDGGAVGRLLPHGSVVLYRPGPAAALTHRVLEVDAGGTIATVLRRDPRGDLEAAWITLAEGGLVGVLPGGADHPLWGASDRLVRLRGDGSTLPLTVASAVRWNAVDTIPAMAEPGRLPVGAGSALVNVLAALAEDQGRPALRYRGPYPTEQLFWTLTESFRTEGGADALARFLADAEGAFVEARLVEVPVDWWPAPHERRLHPDDLVAQLREGVERVTWKGRGYHRPESLGLRRREHRVVRAVDAREGTTHYLASLEALGIVIEDHLRLDARGTVLDRYPPASDPPVETRLGEPWREALGALVALEATPLLASAIDAVWPDVDLGWGPVDGDLVDGSATGLRLSPKLARAYRTAISARTAGRHALAQQLVREVLGLIGPAVRQAAVAWLEALPAARQAIELERAAHRDRATLAAAALAPLGRLLAALESGGALPA